MLRRMIFMALAAIALINTCELKAAVSIWDTVWVAQEPPGVSRGYYTFSKSGDKFYSIMEGGEYDRYICEFSDATGEMLRPVCYYPDSLPGLNCGLVMSDTNKILYLWNIYDISTCTNENYKTISDPEFLGAVPFFDPETNCIWQVSDSKGLVRYNLDTKTIVDSINKIPNFEFMNYSSIYLSPLKNKLILSTSNSDMTLGCVALFDAYDLKKYTIIIPYGYPRPEYGWRFDFSDNEKYFFTAKSNENFTIRDLETLDTISSFGISEPDWNQRATFFDSSSKYIVSQKYSEPLLFYSVLTGELLYYTNVVSNFSSFIYYRYPWRKYQTNSYYFTNHHGIDYKIQINFNDSLLAVNNQEAYKLNVFYTNNLNILYSDTESPQDLYVFDIQGNVVFKSEGIIPNNSQFELSLPSGVYFAGVTMNGNNIVKKFIITN